MFLRLEKMNAGKRRKKTQSECMLYLHFVLPCNKIFVVEQTFPNYIVENPKVNQLRNSKPDLSQRRNM